MKYTLMSADEEYDKTLELTEQLFEQVVAYAQLDIPTTHKIDKLLANVRRSLEALNQLEYKSQDVDEDDPGEDGGEGDPDLDAFEDEHDILWSRFRMADVLSPQPSGQPLS